MTGAAKDKSLSPQANLEFPKASKLQVFTQGHQHIKVWIL